MDFPPEFAVEKNFVFYLLREAPELGLAWEEYSTDEYEFIPTSAMYDLARGIVQLVNKQLFDPATERNEALIRIFACLEEGMLESEDGPIPNLIRLTMCDWLGRQSDSEQLYSSILSYMGPNLKYWLVTKDGKMPFRNKVNKESLQTVAKVRSVPKSRVLSIVEGQELEVLLKVSWTFVLFTYGHRYFLSVVCGSVALYNVNIELSAEEIDLYRREGEDGIAKLAREVFNNPSMYEARKIEIPTELYVSAKKE